MWIKMRFIGSKKNIVGKIEEVLNKHTDGSENTFLDLFAGSNAVGNYFAKKYKIISNDIMYFSYVMARGSLAQKGDLQFHKLKQLDISDPFKYFNSISIDNCESDFVTLEYSPAGPDRRMYFTEDNAKKVDFCRNTIENWKKENLVNDSEYFYLLASLLNAVPYISNTTGTYGAFLKKWDKRAFKPLTLEAPPLYNYFNNEAYNEDSLNLISKLDKNDICYIDTPYNTRQYPSNYHVLEMIAKWNKPELKGVTGQPNLDDEKSDFAVKRKAFKSMEKLLSQIRAKHVIVSYSSDGIIQEEDFINLIKKYAKPNTFEEYKFNYRKYKSKIYNDKKVSEILFYFQPKQEPKINKREESIHLNANLNINSPQGYIKSPLNYVGGKYKLLPQIIPLFPQEITTFIDLFSGGANIGINVNADKIVFNDINTKINEFFRYLQENDIDDILTQINRYISQYKLSKTNEEGFKKFRVAYNENPNPIMLYTLVSYSFNYQFRFNNDMKFNNPFGRNRSHFSKRMENNLIKFTKKLHQTNAEFVDYYFNKLNFDNLDNRSFVYADPPYLITTGSYNDGNRGFVNWTKKQEKQLYDLLDNLSENNIRFALSNVLEHKGIKNESLIRWSEKYNVHHLNYSYSNSSHNTTHLGSDEVLITNFKIS